MNFFNSLKIKILAALVVLFSVNSLFSQKVVADGLCDILPCGFAPKCLFGLECNGDALSQVGSILELLLSFIFVAIVAYGIWLIVQAAIKIIRSNGDEEQIQSGMKLIKGAYTGIILIFVGIIGLVVVFAIFNATDIFKVQTPDSPPGINSQ